MKQYSHILIVSDKWIAWNKFFLILTLFALLAFLLSKIPWMINHSQYKMTYFIMALMMTTSACMVACLYNELYFAILFFNLLMCTQFSLFFTSDHREVLEPFFQYTGLYLFFCFLGIRGIYTYNLKKKGMRPQLVAYHHVRHLLATAFIFCLWVSVPERDFRFLFWAI